MQTERSKIRVVIDVLIAGVVMLLIGLALLIQLPIDLIFRGRAKALDTLRIWNEFNKTMVREAIHGKDITLVYE